MNSISVRFEIEELCKRLQIAKDKISEVRKDQWRNILLRTEERFLAKTHYSQGLHWGWNRLKDPKYTVEFIDKPYKYFQYLIEDDSIWFIVEDFDDKMWIYEGASKFIFNQVIPELVHLKEYYLVSKKFKWLACENHHTILCLSGKEIIDRMMIFKQKNSEEIISES